jgi:hypothetical protein
MVSIENSNLEIALADLLAAVLGVSRRVGHAIYFKRRAAALRIEIVKAAASEKLRPSVRANASSPLESQKRKA